MCVCVTRPPGRVVQLGHYVVVFQPRPWTITELASINYHYVYVGSNYACPFPIA